MKRPRLYRDRRWVEGYEAAALALRTNDPGPSFPRLSRFEAEWKLKLYGARLRSPKLGLRLTAWEQGHAAGLLDAFGL